MATVLSSISPKPPVKPKHPFWRAVLRGLGVVLPPLLTIVIFLWVGNSIQQYILVPMENAVQRVLVTFYMPAVLKEIPPEVPREARVPDRQGRITFPYDDRIYVEIENGQFMPQDVVERVAQATGMPPPPTARGIYMQYVRIIWMKRFIVVPVFLAGFILVLYAMGKFLAAGIGRFTWTAFERLVNNLPLIRTVYGSVKQVTDFIFSEREVQFNRVVAVEYPRKGIWSMGFVTGESMLDIRAAANEPVLSILIPSSPMPATGYTITVRKSETIDLNITMDQAFQFCVSCGVVVPPHQQSNEMEQRILAAIGRGGSKPAGEEEDCGANGKSAVEKDDEDGDALPPPPE